jgi:hypothetical protein
MPDDWPWHGFVFEHRGVNLPPSLPPLNWYITVPYWSIVIALAPLPIVWMRHRWHAARAKQEGKCSKCGYDLRASPERCPECGVVPERVGKAA